MFLIPLLLSLKNISSSEFWRTNFLAFYEILLGIESRKLQNSYFYLYNLRFIADPEMTEADSLKPRPDIEGQKKVWIDTASKA